jgi:hypothetical protein
MNMLLRLGMAFPLLFGLNSLGAAQGLTPFGSNSSTALGAAGGILPPTRSPLFSGSHDAPIHMHTGPTGKLCLTVLGYAAEQVINPNIFTHIISVSNDCSQAIKIQVCYYQSHDCTTIDVPGYGRKEATLGIMPAMKDFRFEYKEQFDQGSVFGGAGMRLY